MLKKSFLLALLSICLCSIAEASTCITGRMYRLTYVSPGHIVRVTNAPGGGVWSWDWVDWRGDRIVFPSDGALFDEMFSWEGSFRTLEFLDYLESPCNGDGDGAGGGDGGGDDGCDNGDCCGLGCLQCFGFDSKKYEFLISFFPPCEDEEEECPDLNLRITGTTLPARRGTARISGDWCKSLGCSGSKK